MLLFNIIELIFLFLFLVKVSFSTPRHGKELTCPCGEYLIKNLLEEETINGIDLKLTNEYINKKSFGNVKHAYWESENKCVALKKSEIKKGMRDPITFMDLSDVRKLAIEREVEVLEYINKNVNDDKRNYIIKMFGYEERNNGENDHFMYIVLELEGKNLRQYYDEKIKEQGGEVERRENEELLLKIIKGAAKALEQFHNFGVHGDVKSENFVIFLEQNPELDFIEVKIIDFNLSIVGDLRTLLDTGLLSRPFKAPEIKNTDNLTRAADIWAFGQMVKSLLPPELPNDDLWLRTKHNAKLNRVIRECCRVNPNDRPEINTIYEFLNNEIEFLTKNDEKDQKEIAEIERTEKKNRRRKNWLKNFLDVVLIKTTK